MESSFISKHKSFSKQYSSSSSYQEKSKLELMGIFMVRKQLARRPVVLPYSSSSSSSSAESSNNPKFIELYRGKMSKKKKSLPIVTRIDTKDLGLGHTLSQSDGSWEDTRFYFVRKYPILDSYYYRNLSPEYSILLESDPTSSYNQHKVDLLFTDCVGVNMIFAPRKEKYIVPEMDEMVRTTFHMDEDIEWRWPKPREKIYHRPEGDYVGVWLEHLRSGYHPRSHQFLKSLCSCPTRPQCCQVD